MFIYKISNNVNGKVYIGQSIRPIEQRFRRHLNDALNNILDTHFARAIREYGKDAFKIEQIDIANNQEELNRKEQYWIRYYNSINNGYNETDAISKCGGNTYFSKTENEMKEICSKISKTKLGSLNPNSHKIKCYNIKTCNELVFDTVKECQEYFGEKTHRFITTRVKGETKSLYNKEWRIVYYENEYGDYTIVVEKPGIKLEVVDVQTGKITCYNSIRKASKYTKINRRKIGMFVSKGINFVIDKFEFKII